MGTFLHRIDIAAGESGPFISLDAVVETGAFYTWIPRPYLERLGVGPRDTRQFVLADGRTIAREVAIIAIRLDGKVLPTLCVIGDVDTTPLLGAFTLEGFALSADPVNKRLVPLPYLFMLDVYPSAQRHPGAN